MYNHKIIIIKKEAKKIIATDFQIYKYKLNNTYQRNKRGIL